MNNVEEAAKWIAVYAGKDCPVSTIEDKLKQDLRMAPERVLSQQECRDLVCGDAAGVVPPTLKRLLPKTDEYLTRYFGPMA